MSFSTAIMAHPSRLGLAEELAARMDGEIVLDEYDDEWETGARALTACGPEPWHLVLQDDAILAEGLRLLIPSLIEHSHGHPISLYIGEPRPFPERVEAAALRAHHLDTPWIRGPGPWWGVALLMPTPFAVGAAEWGRLRDEPYDERICKFSRHESVEWLYTFPSLVDHRSVFESPSIYEGREANRRAVYFDAHPGTRRRDWAKAPVSMLDKIPFRHSKTGRIAKARKGEPHYERLMRSDRWNRIPEEEPAW